MASTPGALQVSSGVSLSLSLRRRIFEWRLLLLLFLPVELLCDSSSRAFSWRILALPSPHGYPSPAVAQRRTTCCWKKQRKEKKKYSTVRGTLSHNVSQVLQKLLKDMMHIQLSDTLNLTSTRLSDDPKSLTLVDVKEQSTVVSSKDFFSKILLYVQYCAYSFFLYL